MWFNHLAAVKVVRRALLALLLMVVQFLVIVPWRKAIYLLMLGAVAVSSCGEASNTHVDDAKTILAKYIRARANVVQRAGRHVLTVCAFTSWCISSFMVNGSGVRIYSACCTFVWLRQCFRAWQVVRATSASRSLPSKCKSVRHYRRAIHCDCYASHRRSSERTSEKDDSGPSQK